MKNCSKFRSFFLASAFFYSWYLPKISCLYCVPIDCVPHSTTAANLDSWTASPSAPASPPSRWSRGSPGWRGGLRRSDSRGQVESLNRSIQDWTRSIIPAHLTTDCLVPAAALPAACLPAFLPAFLPGCLPAWLPACLPGPPTATATRRKCFVMSWRRISSSQYTGLLTTQSTLAKHCTSKTTLSKCSKYWVFCNEFLHSILYINGTIFLLLRGYSAAWL